MRSLDEMYDQALREAVDIAAHLPRLKWLAGIHDRVTEFGVRNGASTIALLMGNPDVESWDLEPCANIEFISKASPMWLFRQANVLEVEIGHTDLLFIDTLHTYDQLSAELAKHAGKVRRTIALHDTYCQVNDGTNDPAGMWKAIAEFLVAEPQWSVVLDEPECNGLTVLGR